MSSFPFLAAQEIADDKIANSVSVNNMMVGQPAGSKADPAASSEVFMNFRRFILSLLEKEFYTPLKPVVEGIHSE